MSTSWRAAVHYKQHCVWNVLEHMAPGSHLLLTDGDVTFFQDPLRVLLALGPVVARALVRKYPPAVTVKTLTPVEDDGWLA